MLHNTLMVRIFIVVWYQNANKGTIDVQLQCARHWGTRETKLLRNFKVTTRNNIDWNSELKFRTQHGNGTLAWFIKYLNRLKFFDIQCSVAIWCPAHVKSLKISFRVILSRQFIKPLNKYSASRSQCSIPLKCINIAWHIPKSLQVGKFRGHLTSH